MLKFRPVALPEMRRIIFLHIPKTAGTTVSQVLLADFLPDEVFPPRLVPLQVTYSIEALSRYRLFCGHLDWSDLDCVPGEKFTFTFLRRPLDRIISNYYFWKGLADAGDPHQLIRDGLQHLADLGEYSSMAEYFLESRESVKSIVDYTFNNMYSYYFAYRRFGWCYIKPVMLRPDQVLANALSNLSRLDFVGITEFMPESLKTLAAVLGRPAIAAIPHANRTPLIAEKTLQAYDEIRSDPRLRSKLEEFTAIDNVLYERMVCRFDDGGVR